MSLSHNQIVLFTRQRHEAERMGLHWDYRIVVGGKAYSWATKKELPEPGKAILLHEQPIHTAHYALTPKVVIPSGQYGAGVTTLDWVLKGKIHNPEESGDKFVIETKDGQRFLLKRMPQYSNKAWLFKNLKEPEKNKYLDKVAAVIDGDILKLMDIADDEHKEKYPNWSQRDREDRKNRVPIRYEGDTVGFYTPYKTSLGWRTGTIYVHPDYRGKGIGTKAIQDFFVNKKNGMAYIEPDNLASMAAFIKAGFKEKKRKTFWQEENEPTEYALMIKE